MTERRRQITLRSRSFAVQASRSVIKANKSASPFTNGEINNETKAVSFVNDAIVRVLTRISKSDRFSVENNLLARRVMYEVVGNNYNPIKVISILESDTDSRKIEASLDREIFTMSYKVNLEGFFPTKFFPLGRIDESKMTMTDVSELYEIEAFPDRTRVYLDDRDYISYIRDGATSGYKFEYIKLDDEYHREHEHIKLNNNTLVEVTIIFI